MSTDGFSELSRHTHNVGGAVTYQRVLSSCIAEIGYDLFDQTLAVRFHSGSEYRYDGIAPQTYQDLLTADSIGRFFNAEIRDHYPHQRNS